MTRETPAPEVLGSPDEGVLKAATQLLRSCQSLSLASTDARGRPLASYAPFVILDGSLHVFISDLAAHSANLAREQPVSVLLMEDEATMRQPFARARLTTCCSVTALVPGAAQTMRALDALHQRFGAVVATLRQLPDFTLYRLSPLSAQLVQGFGQAFALDAAHLARILDAAGDPLSAQRSSAVPGT